MNPSNTAYGKVSNMTFLKKKNYLLENEDGHFDVGYVWIGLKNPASAFGIFLLSFCGGVKPGPMRWAQE